MSKNNSKPLGDRERSDERRMSQQHLELLHLFNQLGEQDKQHIIRLLHALRDTAR